MGIIIYTAWYITTIIAWSHIQEQVTGHCPIQQPSNLLKALMNEWMNVFFTALSTQKGHISAQMLLKASIIPCDALLEHAQTRDISHNLCLLHSYIYMPDKVIASENGEVFSPLQCHRTRFEQCCGQTTSTHLVRTSKPQRRAQGRITLYIMHP